MQTQNREGNRLGNAYRNFSRERYNTLKQQHSRLRESDIVSKVIKEWDAMSNAQKEMFLNNSNQRMVALNVEPLSTPSKDALGKSNLKSTGLKMMDKEGSELSIDNIEVKEFDLSVDSSNRKTKKIAKKDRNEYISFHKFHFKKLSQEHKKWSSKQVNKIISLLWQKKKNHMMKPMKTRSMKAVSGRKFFLNLKKNEGISAEKRMDLWKRMPMETRNLYKKKGNPSMELRSLNNKAKKMKLEHESNMSFLRNKMM